MQLFPIILQNGLLSYDLVIFLLLIKLVDTFYEKALHRHTTTALSQLLTRENRRALSVRDHRGSYFVLA